MSTQNTQEELIYGYDPLCGWCYAFRPVMEAVTEAHPDLHVRIACGGLVVGERVGPIADSRGYLLAGQEQLRQRAGVVFGDAFLNGLLAEGTHISNSEPPCRAVWVAQQIAPDRAYAFAHELPHAHYWRGLPLDEANVLGDLAAEQGIDRDAFIARWQSDEAKRETQAWFAASRAEGVTMYPTLFYRDGNDTHLIVRGYLPPSAVVERLSALRKGEGIVAG